MTDPILGTLITIALVLANAFFVAAEFGIVKVRGSQIEVKAQSGSRTARMAQNVLNHLDSYLSVCQLGITLASLGLGWVGEPVVGSMVIALMGLFGLDTSIAANQELAHRIALPVAFVLITFLHIVFGELIPKSFAIRRAESTTLGVAFPLRFFYLIFKPAILVLNGLANAMLKAIGIEPASEHEEAHSGEELRLLLEQGKEGGMIEQEEHELIENVFDFHETVVKQVMIPRTSIAALEVDASREDLVKFVVEEGYTRMPVYSGSIDNIIGVVYSKDLITLFEHNSLIILQDLLRPAHFVPETKQIHDLLREFQRMKIQMAIVVDEHGGTAGLVTMEDILEELVGEIQDEYDEESIDIERVSDGAWVVNAALAIDDVNDRIEGFVLPEGEDYTTIAGLVTKWFGRIPVDNDALERDGVRMTVLKTVKRQVVQVKLEDLNRESKLNGLDAFAAEEESEEREAKSEEES